MLHLLHHSLLDRAAASDATQTASIARLLHLLMIHTGAWQKWRGQSLAQVRNVDMGHHEKGANSVPHVALLVELGLAASAEVDLMLLKFVKRVLQTALKSESYKIVKIFLGYPARG